MSNFKGTQVWDIFFISFFRRSQLRMVEKACKTRLLKIAFDLTEIFELKKFRGQKSFPRLLSQQWNCFPAYFEWWFWKTGCNFHLCWACAKNGYSLAEHSQHTRKSFLHTTCISGIFPLSPVPLSPSSLCKETIPPKIPPPFPQFPSATTRGSQRDVVYLSWPIAPSYMSPKCGGGRGGVAGS